MAYGVWSCTAVGMTDARRATAATLFLMLCAASPLHADTLTLTWDANAEAVTGYAVYTGAAPGAYSARTDVGNTVWFTKTDAVAGQQYCFAVAAYVDPAAEGPKSAEVCGFANAAPTLANPGTQSSTTGQPVALQLSGSDPDGQPVSYTATGLPPGLTLMESTGFISGSGTASGTYTVTARVSDGVLSASQSFTWAMAAAAPTADTVAPTVTIATPTSSTTYATATSAVSLTGTASDAGGVTRVDWSSDRGGGGTATGTTDWSVASVALQAGANVITISARDAAGNIGMDVLTVTYTPPDTTAPSVSVTSPTAANRYDTLFSALTLAGAASDNIGVTSVTWANSRGGGGTASGTTNWSVALTLQQGDNIITVTARDAAGNTRSAALTVNYIVPDTSAPNVRIVDPTTQDSYATDVEIVSLSGDADDDVAVTDVTWSNNRGGSGTASGTTRWSVPAVTLQQGTNVITITARDGAGNQRSKTLTIEIVAPGTPSFTLAAQLFSKSRVQLAWGQVDGRYLDVYRDGSSVATTRNNGSYNEALRGSGQTTYRVCVSGTTICSNSVSVTP